MRNLTIALVALSLVVTTSDADAKKKHPKTKKPTIQTGDPLPKKPSKNPKCQDKGAVRFIGSGPSTPLAIVQKGKIESAGDACCAPWAVKGASYKALDAFGQIVGDAQISGGEGYDVTQCYELELATKKGKPGVGLYVDGPFVAPKSAAWTPSASELASLGKTIAALEHALVENAPYSCPSAPALRPLADRALTFSFKDGKDVQQYAVVGGPLLIVARLQADGRWIARDFSDGYPNTCMQRAYEPRAVVDMNGDGVPELVVHDDLGDSFGDIVFGYEAGRYQHIASAVHGSTA